MQVNAAQFVNWAHGLEFRSEHFVSVLIVS
jgi:hypothetical protein